MIAELSGTTIDFARLWALLVLPLPILAWRLLPKRAERAAVPVPASVGAWLTALSATDAATRLGIPPGLFWRLLGWLCLVVAFAGPYTTGKSLLPPTGRDLIMAIDLSASMAETDVLAAGARRERIAIVRDLAGEFVGQRQGDRIGLIAFASEAFLIAPLTFDGRAISQMLDELAIGLPGRKTDLGLAIGLAVQSLKHEPPAKRLLIILSDGEANAGDLSASDAASLAAEIGMTIHMIGFAGDIDSPKAQFMQDIAERTGGRYFAATSSETLAEVYAQINRLSPISTDSDRPHLVTDWTWLPLLLALGALSMITWRELRDA